MVDYDRILNEWKRMSEDDKRRFIYFTYILCDYFGGDTNWCDFDGLISDYEKRFVMDDMPKDINNVIHKEDFKREVENEQLRLPGIVSMSMRAICDKLNEEFSGYHLSAAVMHAILNRFKEVTEERFRNTFMHPKATFKDDEDGMGTDAFITIDGNYGIKYKGFVRFGIVDDEPHINIHDESVIEGNVEI